MKLNRFTRLVTAMGAVLAGLALLASTASAAEEPAEGYEGFAGCPSPEETKIEACIRSVVTGGHFQMGSKDVPISNPITISGGVTSTFGFAYNENGGLTPVKQQVPGGIIGLTGLDWLIDFLDLEGLKLYAVTELAGTLGIPLLDPFALPVKVHLINPILGNHCYVGSDTTPISLNLTRGTTNPPPPNESIGGQEPKVEIDLKKQIIHAKEGVLVDNSFAAPGASGCVLHLGFIPISINGLVNLQSGLPSPAGTNETVQNTDTEITDQVVVYP